MSEFTNSFGDMSRGSMQTQDVHQLGTWAFPSDKNWGTTPLNDHGILEYQNTSLREIMFIIHVPILNELDNQSKTGSLSPISRVFGPNEKNHLGMFYRTPTIGWLQKTNDEVHWVKIPHGFERWPLECFWVWGVTTHWTSQHKRDHFGMSPEIFKSWIPPARGQNWRPPWALNHSLPSCYFTISTEHHISSWL